MKAASGGRNTHVRAKNVTNSVINRYTTEKEYRAVRSSRSVGRRAMRMGNAVNSNMRRFVKKDWAKLCP